jgi:hypothetical protein
MPGEQCNLQLQGVANVTPFVTAGATFGSLAAYASERSPVAHATGAFMDPPCCVLPLTGMLQQHAWV